MKASNIDFAHLNRIQKRIMSRDSQITEKEFRAESDKNQIEYYRWICKQVGELADLI